MHVTIRLFAAAREAVGTSTQGLELAEGATAATALVRLCGDHPQLKAGAAALAMAVNRERVGPDAVLHDGDEVAFLPPFGGG